jgi:large subunit ribosomal protein L2
MNSFKVLSKSNGQRHAVLMNRTILWKKKAMRALTRRQISNAGRTNTGMVACRTHGSASRTRVRAIDQIRLVCNVPGRVLRLEYDPRRSAFIIMVVYANGISMYTLAAHGIHADALISAYASGIGPHIAGALSITFNTGDSCTMEHMPPSTTICDVERQPQAGGCLARSGGTYCLEIRKYVGIRRCLVQLPSKQLLSIPLGCRGMRGMSSNILHSRYIAGKAGRSRHKGSHPVVRGVAQNPVDHPHGGGEGKKSKKCFPRTA